MLKRKDINIIVNFHDRIICVRRKVEKTIKYINFRRLFDVSLQLFIISLTFGYKN